MNAAKVRANKGFLKSEPQGHEERENFRAAGSLRNKPRVESRGFSLLLLRQIVFQDITQANKDSSNGCLGLSTAFRWCGLTPVSLLLFDPTLVKGPLIKAGVFLMFSIASGETMISAKVLAGAEIEVVAGGRMENRFQRPFGWGADRTRREAFDQIRIIGRRKRQMLLGNSFNGEVLPGVSNRRVRL